MDFRKAFRMTNEERYAVALLKCLRDDFALSGARCAKDLGFLENYSMCGVWETSTEWPGFVRFYSISASRVSRFVIRNSDLNC
jgi:hypothetical protein